MNGTHPTPTPSLRECTSLLVTAQKFRAKKKPVSKPSARSNHRTTLPQSALRAASSLREGAGNGCGGWCHSTGYLLNRKGAGDFHRPYETQIFLHFTIQRTGPEVMAFWVVVRALAIWRKNPHAGQKPCMGIFLAFYLVPKMRSPASPRPGTM